MPNQNNDFLFDFSVSSHFFIWFFSLSSHNLPLSRVLSLLHSSLDQIPSFSLNLNLNLKRLSLSLYLKSNPNKHLSSLFIERQRYGLGRDWLIGFWRVVGWVLGLGGGVGCDFGIGWFWWVWIFVGFGGGLRCKWARPNPDQNRIVVWSYIVLHCCCPWSRRLVLHNSLPTSLNQVVGVRFGMVLWIWDLGWCRWVWDFWLWAVVWCYRFGGNFS